MNKTARLVLMLVAVMLIRPGRAEAARVSNAVRNPAFEPSAQMQAAFRPSRTFRVVPSSAFRSSPAMRQAFAPSAGFHQSSSMQELFKDTRRVPVSGGHSPSSVRTSGTFPPSGTPWRIGQFPR